MRAVILHALHRRQREVFGFALLTLAGAVALWVVAYGVAYWVTQFLVVVLRGEDAPVPAHFREWALAAGGLLLLAAWWEKWLHPYADPRLDKARWEITVDFLLALPRVTLAVWTGLAEWPRLSRRDLAAATALAEAVQSAERLPLQAAPLFLPEEKRREAIVLTLLIIQILESRREEGQPCLAPGVELRRRAEGLPPA